MKTDAAYAVGFCCASSDEKALGKELLKVLAQPDIALHYRPAILWCGTQEFDGRRMRDKLQTCLRKYGVTTS